MACEYHKTCAYDSNNGLKTTHKPWCSTTVCSPQFMAVYEGWWDMGILYNREFHFHRLSWALSESSTMLGCDCVSEHSSPRQNIQGHGRQCVNRTGSFSWQWTVFHKISSLNTFGLVAKWTLRIWTVCERFWYVILKDRTVTYWLLHYGQVVTYCMDVTLLIRPQKR